MNNLHKQYIILLTLIFISLGVGIFMFGIKEASTTMNDNNNEQGGEIINGNTSLNSNMRYDSNNLDVVYHSSPTELMEDSDYQELKSKTVYVAGENGNVLAIPMPTIQSGFTYHEPNTYSYGSATYIPNYEDSVYLSRTTGLSTLSAIKDPAYIKGGICSYYKNQPQQLENACISVDKNLCASTSCCVLLGGAKCVSGNENGPIVRSNYSDVYIPNRDFYYYQGKCYGNCP